MNDEKGSKLPTGLSLAGVLTLLGSLGGAASGVPDVVALVREFGFPIGFLLLGGAGVVAACRYLAGKVVEPLVSHTTTFVKTATEETRKQTTTLECMRVEASADRRDAAEDRKTAAEERRDAAEERKTTRLALEDIRAKLTDRSPP